MTTLLTLIGALLLAHWICLLRARRRAAEMIRPAEEWDGYDVDRWLALIEPFPLADPTREQKS